MRTYVTGRVLNALTAAPRGGNHLTPSTHRLWRGLPGYLILFATHAFAPQRQLQTRESPSPLVFLHISTHFTAPRDRKSTRLNSSHVAISYAVFCLKKKKTYSSRVYFHLDYTHSRQTYT